MAVSHAAPQNELGQQFELFKQCDYLFNAERWSKSDIERKSSVHPPPFQLDTFLTIEYDHHQRLSAGCIVQGMADLTHHSVSTLARLGHVLHSFQKYLGVIERSWRENEPFATPCKTNDPALASTYNQPAFLLADETFLYFQYQVEGVIALAPMRLGWLETLIQLGYLEKIDKPRWSRLSLAVQQAPSLRLWCTLWNLVTSRIQTSSSKRETSPTASPGGSLPPIRAAAVSGTWGVKA